MNKYICNKPTHSSSQQSRWFYAGSHPYIYDLINLTFFIYLIYIQEKYSKLETHAYDTFCLIHADVKVFEGMYVVHWYGTAS